MDFHIGLYAQPIYGQSSKRGHSGQCLQWCSQWYISEQRAKHGSEVCATRFFGEWEEVDRQIRRLLRHWWATTFSISSDWVNAVWYQTLMRPVSLKLHLAGLLPVPRILQIHFGRVSIFTMWASYADKCFSLRWWKQQYCSMEYFRWLGSRCQCRCSCPVVSILIIPSRVKWWFPDRLQNAFRYLRTQLKFMSDNYPAPGGIYLSEFGFTEPVRKSILLGLIKIIDQVDSSNISALIYTISSGMKGEAIIC